MTESTEQTLAGLQRELQQAHAFQAATDEVLRTIAASPGDPQPVFDAIADCALTLCEAQFSAVGRFDGELVHLAAIRGASPELVQAVSSSFPMPPGRGSGLAEIVHEQATINTADLLDESDYTFREDLGRAGFRGALGIPLMHNGECVGSIGVLRTAPGLFSEPLVNLMQTFADQAVIAIENARMFHVTREALEHQTASAEVLRMVSDSVADAQPVFEKIVESCERLFSASHVILLLLRDDEHLVRVAHNGELNSEIDGLPREFPLAGSATERAIRERQTVHYPRVVADSVVSPSFRTLYERIGEFSTLLAPLLAGKSAIGSLLLSRYPPKPFTPTEIALLTTFTDQAVIAIENARMFRETQEALERQTATAEVLNAISQSPTDVQPVFDAIVARAAALTGAGTAVATRLVGGQLHLVSVFGASEEEMAGARAVFPVEPSSNTLNGRTALAKAPVQVPDFSLEDDYAISVPGIPQASGLAVPLLQNGQVLGTLMVIRREIGRFADNVVDLFQTFADQAVIALENTRLFRETQEALERQTATAEILQVISESPTDVQPVFDVIVERARTICSAGIGTLTSYDGEFVQLVAEVGLPPDMSARYLVSKFVPGDSDTASIRAILSGKPAQIPDMWADARLDYQELAQKSSFRSALAVPMLSDGRCIGAIGVARKEVGEFPDKLVTLLQTFASQAVIALQNVRLFNETREALER